MSTYLLKLFYFLDIEYPDIRKRSYSNESRKNKIRYRVFRYLKKHKKIVSLEYFPIPKETIKKIIIEGVS